MITHLKRTLVETGSVAFSVRVRPQAQTTCLKKPLTDGTLKIDLAAVPEDGAANEELIRFLAYQFDVPRASVELVSGQTARKKMIRIAFEPLAVPREASRS